MLNTIHHQGNAKFTDIRSHHHRLDGHKESLTTASVGDAVKKMASSSLLVKVQNGLTVS